MKLAFSYIQRMELIEAAQGLRPMDLIITNIQLVNVFTGEIYPAHVGIYHGRIAHIEADPDKLDRFIPAMQSKEIFNGENSYLLPGLIDSHLHIESSMLTPPHFAEVTVPWGTTTLITDPHEIANVLGLEGVRYMIDMSKNLPQRHLTLAPSCVPAVPKLENAGATFTAQEIKTMLEWEEIYGLGEVMDYLGVTQNQARISDILSEAHAQHVFLQGHAHFLSGRLLSSYLCAGIESDHESRTPQEVRDKMRAGLFIEARESSISKNVSAIVAGLQGLDLALGMSLCTDDREPADLLESGHINDVVNSAIQAGLPIIEAIRAATLYPAREHHLLDLGAIAPGYIADCILVKDLKHLQPTHVFYEGQLVAQNNRLSQRIDTIPHPLETYHSVDLQCPTPSQLKIKAPLQDGKIMINVICYEQLTSSKTKLIQEKVTVKEGVLDLTNHPDLFFVGVFNRYPNQNSFALAVVKGFGITQGAWASTVSHDSHNLTVVYRDVIDAQLVIQRVIDMQGGMASAHHHHLTGDLALPIAGLLSLKPANHLAKDIEAMKHAIRDLGLNSNNPLLRITTLALPVIPGFKMSDRGIIDVLKQDFIPLFAN